MTQKRWLAALAAAAMLTAGPALAQEYDATTTPPATDDPQLLEETDPAAGPRPGAEAGLEEAPEYGPGLDRLGADDIPWGDEERGLDPPEPTEGLEAGLDPERDRGLSSARVEPEGPQPQVEYEEDPAERRDYGEVFRTGPVEQGIAEGAQTGGQPGVGGGQAGGLGETEQDEELFGEEQQPEAAGAHSEEQDEGWFD